MRFRVVLKCWKIFPQELSNKAKITLTESGVQTELFSPTNRILTVKSLDSRLDSMLKIIYDINCNVFLGNTALVTSSTWSERSGTDQFGYKNYYSDECLVKDNELIMWNYNFMIAPSGLIPVNKIKYMY